MYIFHYMYVHRLHVLVAMGIMIGECSYPAFEPMLSLQVSSVSKEL